ncbi:type II secretion system protein GspN [Desulfobacula toluolica]|uniref:Conserved uncharacterized protein n=1 Tax=Desulfobacula toluolica (strain DSM 7467 / Tol2) TaxID=651182 RepID=K0NF98_DESTT|nr:type II secretion system protein GspN [Desulfobacula toluolica]CCK79550.1 conserved uncharacterized protein [Desulfobacula toluolica Tol2]
MKLKIFGYFIFIAVCLLFSLYVHFPGKTAAKYIEQMLSHIHPGVTLRIDTLNPCFPPGLKADAVQIHYAGVPIATLDNSRLFFDLTTFWGNPVTGTFKAHVLDGALSGFMRLSKETTGDAGIEAVLDNLKLEDIRLGELLSDGQLSGILNGTLTAVFEQGNILQNKGDLNFADLVLQFPEALFSVETYSFSSGKLKFSMSEDHLVKVENCSLTGRQIDLHLSGIISMAKIFQNSRLNLKTKIVLYPLFFMNAGDEMPVDVSRTDSDNAFIHLRIGGTIQYPIITIDPGIK